MAERTIVLNGGSTIKGAADIVDTRSGAASNNRWMCYHRVHLLKIVLNGGQTFTSLGFSLAGRTLVHQDQRALNTVIGIEWRHQSATT